MRLTEDELSPFDVSFKLNETLLSFLDYRNPRDAFKSLGAGKHGLENGDG